MAYSGLVIIIQLEVVEVSLMEVRLMMVRLMAVGLIMKLKRKVKKHLSSKICLSLKNCLSPKRR